MSRLENSAPQEVMGREAERSLAVLESLLSGRREQLVHDVWTLHFVFASSEGPWRRAGFASRVLVRAAVAEMDRLGGLCADPLEAAFWVLNAQRRLLNHDVVDERVTRAVFSSLHYLRPSQQRAARRLLRARTENLAHPEGSAGSNLLLLAAAAGGLSWIQELDSFRTALELRFEGDPPLRAIDRLQILRLEPEERLRLDERALAFDLAHRLRGQA
jgi:hypothetical protein